MAYIITHAPQIAAALTVAGLCLGTAIVKLRSTPKTGA